MIATDAAMLEELIDYVCLPENVDVPPPEPISLTWLRQWSEHTIHIREMV